MRIYAISTPHTGRTFFDGRPRGLLDRKRFRDVFPFCSATKTAPKLSNVRRFVLAPQASVCMPVAILTLCNLYLSIPSRVVSTSGFPGNDPQYHFIPASRTLLSVTWRIGNTPESGIGILRRRERQSRTHSHLISLLLISRGLLLAARNVWKRVGSWAASSSPLLRRARCRRRFPRLRRRIRTRCNQSGSFAIFKCRNELIYL